MSNPRFRFLLSLEKSKVRRQEALTAVEGLKEIEMALLGGFEFVSLFYVETLADKALFLRICKANPGLDLYALSHDLFAKAATRESSGGMIAVLRTPELSLEALRLPAEPLLLIVDGVEKPGNLGAMLRTADAAAVDAVICCDLPGDLYNPNTIRASLGTVFTVPVCLAEGEALRNWLQKHQVKTFCTHLHQAIDYLQADYTGPAAIVMGTEASGVSDAWMQFADQNVKIPMLGKIDSMNVSVAAAIMVYEARRQRSL